MHAMTRLLTLLFVLSLGSQAVAQEPPMLQITHHPARDWHPTWSPDGTQIAFMSNRFVNSQEIMVVPAIFGGQPVRLFHDFASPTVDAPAWSPNGDVIAFHSRIPSPCFCYVIAGATVPGGDTYSILSCCGPNNFSPAWSPDGTQIVFQSDRPEGDAVFDLFVVPATGGPDTQITFGNLDNTEPEWSPDGTQIAFVSRRAGTQDIWLMPATGGTATQLTDYPSSERWPTWSPDGTQIAFARSMNDNMDVWVVPAAGGQPTQLTNHPTDDAYPAWSPDGTRIAFMSERSDSAGDIWVMDLSTTAVEPATVAPAEVKLLASPNPFQDATTIRLVGMEGGGILRVVDVAGRLVREIAAPIAPPSGTPTLVWDGRNESGFPVAPGTYFMTFESGSHRVTGRLVRDR